MFNVHVWYVAKCLRSASDIAIGLTASCNIADILPYTKFPSRRSNSIVEKILIAHRTITPCFLGAADGDLEPDGSGCVLPDRWQPVLQRQHRHAQNI